MEYITLYSDIYVQVKVFRTFYFSILYEQEQGRFVASRIKRTVPSVATILIKHSTAFQMIGFGTDACVATHFASCKTYATKHRRAVMSSIASTLKDISSSGHFREDHAPKCFEVLFYFFFQYIPIE